MITKNCKIHGDISGDDIYDKTFKSKRIIKCKLCIKIKNDKYYKKVYQDENKVAEKKQRDKDRWKERKTEITAKRKQPEALAKRRDAYQKNIEKYRTKCNEKQKIYREQLHDVYIKKIIQNGDKNIPLDRIPRSLIEFKRAIIRFKKGITQTIIINKVEKSYED
jgi:hypothetical protein